jgi:hypothetical protein
MQESDAIQKIIYERPGSTVLEIYARVSQLFSELNITEERVQDHVSWGTDPTQRKQPWLKSLAVDRYWPAVEIRPEWQM